MLLEIESAANFLSDLLRSQLLSSQQLSSFRESTIQHLRDNYCHHWFPEQPFKGSGYRCLRINHKMDPMLSQIGNSVGLHDSHLRSLFPHELTLWVDPNEVSYRIGENGSICVIYQSFGSSSLPRQCSPSPPSTSLSSSQSSSVSSSPSSSPSNWSYGSDNSNSSRRESPSLLVGSAAKNAFYLNSFLS